MQFMSLKQLKDDIKKIKERNKRVELDKAWGTNWTRRIIITLLTYIVIVIFFYFAQLPRPFINSIVPSLAFLISGFTLSIFKNLWMERK